MPHIGGSGNSIYRGDKSVEQRRSGEKGIEKHFGTDLAKPAAQTR
jgi:hypothetical protein